MFDFLKEIPQIDLTGSKLVKSRGKQWMMIRCPLAFKTHSKGTDTNPSFGISEDGFFNCFSCGTKGKIVKLYKILEEFHGIDLSPRILEAKNLFKETVETILSKNKAKEDRLILNDNALIWPSAVEYSEAMEYLSTRRIDASVAKFWDIRYDENKRMVVLPIRTLGLNGAYGRSIEGRVHHNYFGCVTSDCLGGYDKLSDETRRLVILEGFFDVINAFPIARTNGFDCVCTFTSSCSDAQTELIMNTDKRVFCGYDCDPAGEKGWAGTKDRKGIKDLIPFSSRFRWTGVKDFGAMNEEQLNQIFKV
jgi:hypothetical protein